MKSISELFVDQPYLCLLDTKHTNIIRSPKLLYDRSLSEFSSRKDYIDLEKTINNYSTAIKQ